MDLEINYETIYYNNKYTEHLPKWLREIVSHIGEKCKLVADSELYTLIDVSETTAKYKK